MKRRVAVIAAAGLVAVLVGGGLFASNMGFKLTYVLDATGSNSSNSGRNTLSLPYIPMTTLVDSQDLCDDIDNVAGSSVVSGIARLNPSVGNDKLETYNCTTALNFFTLVPQESYEVTVSSTVIYPIVGSHDPTYQVNLYASGSALPVALGGGTSASGRNRWSYPYHSTAADSQQLCQELQTFSGSFPAGVARFNTATDKLLTYNCTTAANFFTFTPGQGYEITVGADILNWIPNHY